MDASKQLSPSPTDLIDWMNGEGLLDLDWDFPEDGDLVAAGMNPAVVSQLVIAVEEEYGVVLAPSDLTPANLATPLSLSKLIAKRKN